MKAAQTYQIGLSVLRGQRKPGSAWTARDALMAQAYIAFEAAICGGCGYPHWLSRNQQLMKLWNVDDPIRCFGCTSLSEFRSTIGEGDYAQADALQFNVELNPKAYTLQFHDETESTSGDV